eukprot:scaffold7222_cov535-Prasinococcus_capsulatus_cf.AAC.8
MDGGFIRAAREFVASSPSRASASEGPHSPTAVQACGRQHPRSSGRERLGGAGGGPSSPFLAFPRGASPYAPVALARAARNRTKARRCSARTAAAAGPLLPLGRGRGGGEEQGEAAAAASAPHPVALPFPLSPRGTPPPATTSGVQPQPQTRGVSRFAAAPGPHKQGPGAPRTARRCVGVRSARAVGGARFFRPRRGTGGGRGAMGERGLGRPSEGPHAWRAGSCACSPRCCCRDRATPSSGQLVRAAYKSAAPAGGADH